MNTVKNKVVLTGNVGKAPEIRTLERGMKMAKFSLATNESYRSASGEWNTDTQWHHITAWGKVADKVEELLDKGTEISLEGKLMSNSYVDKQGVKKYVTGVHAVDFDVVVKEVKAEA